MKESLELLKKPIESRDEAWEKQFLELLPHAHVTLLNETPQMGPDQWPYLLVRMHEEAKEPLAKILPWLAQRGIGLAINPNQEAPDFVLNYGMIWNFVSTGRFLNAANTQIKSLEKVELENGQSITFGAPSKEYLPDYVKSILRQFLQDQGLMMPRIAVMSLDNKSYDLCFSLESLDSPPATEHAGIAEALSWFLPMDYSIMLISERGLPRFFTL